MNSWTIIIIIIAFLVGLSVGYYVSAASSLRNLNKSILDLIPYTTVAGTVIVGLKLILDYMKQSVLAYGHVYKRKEPRVIYGRKGWSYEEKERHEEIAYYLRIVKIRGQASLQCEGMITIKDPDIGSSTNNTIVRTVWKGVKYSRFRDIGIQDDLKLFHVSENKKEILFFSHDDDGDSQIPNTTIEIRGGAHYSIGNRPTSDSQISGDILNCVLSVKIGTNNGNIPRKPFEMKMGDIINTATSE